ncbi:MAG TPA: PRC-barrel domain-containing protein [Thermodesulfobacteriota bacterium]|nr:PRC-barrel domain-containing protein [Thermodesulfobacteriota bacterium]
MHESKQEPKRESKARVYTKYRLTPLISSRVKNMAGEDLGTLEEFMIDIEEGRIIYAVLSFGGFIGLGNKLFAIPWKALMLKPQENIFILNVEKEKLHNAPGFNRENWPNTANPEWDAPVRDYWAV